jgi:hypothetical protein
MEIPRKNKQQKKRLNKNNNLLIWWTETSKIPIIQLIEIVCQTFREKLVAMIKRSINLDLKLVQGSMKITKMEIEIKVKKIEFQVKMLKNLKINQLVVTLTKILNFKIKM